MKKKSIFIIIFLTIISQGAYCQSQCFTYDAAGNRTSRAVCAARISPDDINTTMVNKMAQMSERTETELRSSFTNDLSQLVVYPNPSSGIFSIAGLENVSDYALRVLDNTFLAGKKASVGLLRVLKGDYKGFYTFEDVSGALGYEGGIGPVATEFYYNGSLKQFVPDKVIGGSYDAFSIGFSISIADVSAGVIRSSPDKFNNRVYGLSFGVSALSILPGPSFSRANGYTFLSERY